LAHLCVARELGFFGDPFVVLVPALDPVKRHVAIYRKKPHDLVRPAGCIDRKGLLQTNELTQLEPVHGRAPPSPFEKQQPWATPGNTRGPTDLSVGRPKNHSVAAETPGKKLVRRPPEIQSEAAIVEITKTLYHCGLVSVEVERPLLKGKKIAVAVVMKGQQLERCLREFFKEIMQNQKRMIAAVNVFYHVRRQFVFLCTRARIDKNAAAGLQIFDEFV